MFIDNLAIPKGAENVDARAQVHRLHPAPRRQPADLGGVPLHEPERRGAQAAQPTRSAANPASYPPGNPKLATFRDIGAAGGRRRQAVHRPEGEERLLSRRAELRRRHATGSDGFSAAATDRQRPPGRAGWLLLSPLILWALAFVVAPAVIMLVYSFARRGTLGGVVLELHARELRRRARPRLSPDRDPLDRLRRRSPPLICLAAGYPVAYLIGRADARWRNLLLMAVMVPFWTSFLIRTYAWVTILKSEGLLNSLLLQLQLIAEPLEMLYTPGAGRAGPRLHVPAVHDPADLLERREARRRADRGRARPRRRARCAPSRA